MIYQITIKTLKTMQNVSIFIQSFGFVLCIAFAYNFIKAFYLLTIKTK